MLYSFHKDNLSKREIYMVEVMKERILMRYEIMLILQGGLLCLALRNLCSNFFFHIRLVTLACTFIRR